MNQLVTKFLNRLRALKQRSYRESYSQSGEDLLLESACEALGIAKPVYLDIGANDPVQLSNTYRFYRRGCSGVLIEPNPSLSRRLSEKRPRDKVISCGVGLDEKRAAPFYLLSASVLSTFSKEEAEMVCATSAEKILETIQVPLRRMDEIIASEFPAGVPDIISIDVEGLDKEIVMSTNWKAVRPPIVCVETREFTPDWKSKTIPEITQTLLEADYGIFAMTYVNTVYVDRRRMHNL